MAAMMFLYLTKNAFAHFYYSDPLAYRKWPVFSSQYSFWPAKNWYFREIPLKSWNSLFGGGDCLRLYICLSFNYKYFVLVLFGDDFPAAPMVRLGTAAHQWL